MDPLSFSQSSAGHKYVAAHMAVTFCGTLPVCQEDIATSLLRCVKKQPICAAHEDTQEDGLLPNVYACIGFYNSGKVQILRCLI